MPRLSNSPPTFSTFLGHPTSRTEFISGTWRVYWAPGQRPYDAGTLGYTFGAGGPFFGGAPGPDDYHAPDDWPSLGSPLCPPQVVWLTIRMGLGLVAEDPFVYQWTDRNTDPPTTHYETQANAWRAEALRLGPVFEEVRDRLHTLRPGRTFVRVNNWNVEADPIDYPWFGPDSPMLHSWSNTIDGHDNTAEQFGETNGSGLLTAPAGNVSPARAVDYWMTDFLEIYAGDVSFQGVCQHDTFTEPTFHSGGTIGPLQTAAFEAAYARVVYPFALRWFHPPAPYSLWVSHYAPPAPVDDDSNLPNYDMRLYLAAANDMDALLDLTDPRVIDLAHPGSSTDLEDADYVIRLIADYFGFDPASGLDLPPAV